jgi:hypothetical protein
MGTDYRFIPFVINEIRFAVPKVKFTRLDTDLLPHIRDLIIYKKDLGEDFSVSLYKQDFDHIFTSFRSSYFLRGIDEILTQKGNSGNWPNQIKVKLRTIEEQFTATLHKQNYDDFDVVLDKELDHIYGYCYLAHILDYDWDSLECDDPSREPFYQYVVPLIKFFKRYDPMNVMLLIYSQG